MSFTKLFEFLRGKVDETSRVKKLTDTELETEKEIVTDDLKEDPTNDSLKYELEEIEIEQERRRALAPNIGMKGSLLAPRRLDFSKLSDDALKKLVDLEEQNPEEVLKQLQPENGVPFADFEQEQIFDDLFTEWVKRNPSNQGDPSEEEIAGIEKSWDNRDKTKLEGWNFYGHELGELKDFKAMSDDDLKKELGIESDKELAAARIEIKKVIAEIESWENESVVREIKSIRKILEVKGGKVSFKKVFGLKQKKNKQKAK